MTNEKRLIDANALMDTVEGVNWYHIDKMGYLANGANSQYHTPIYKAEDIYNAIRNAPTVEAVEVVRCAECTKSGCCIIEERLVTARAKDRYCGLGERREGE